MKKLIIHIGYPKTATSTIQNHFFMKLHKEGVLNFLGKGQSGSNKFNPSGNIVRQLTNSNEDIPTKRLELSTDKINVLSNEDFPLSFWNIDTQSYLPVKNPLSTANRLYQYLEANHRDVDIKIIVTLRNQRKLIHSVFTEGYTWYFRHE